MEADGVVVIADQIVTNQRRESKEILWRFDLPKPSKQGSSHKTFAQVVLNENFGKKVSEQKEDFEEGAEGAEKKEEGRSKDQPTTFLVLFGFDFFNALGWPLSLLSPSDSEQTLLDTFWLPTEERLPSVKKEEETVAS
jgi:hypothetical protein